jgi:hypothetical protein
MDTFLQLVGGLAVGGGLTLVVVAAVVIFVIRKKLRQVFKAIALSTAVVAPPRISLVSTLPSFRDRERYAADKAALERAGYREIGGFLIREIREIRLAAFQHPATHAFAVLYQHDSLGVYCDLVLPLPGGFGLTVSSAPAGGEMDNMPGQIKHFLPGTTVAELLVRFDAESRGREVRQVPPEGFAAEVEQTYAREMDWRSARGGPTEAEIRRIASGMGQDVSDEDLSMVRDHHAQQAAAQIEAACREQFLSETSLSPMEWEKIRDEVIVVHARLSPREAGEMFLSSLHESAYDGDGYEEYEAEVERLAASASDPRALFASLNARLTGFRYEKIGQVSEPVPADLYRTP